MLKKPRLTQVRMPKYEVILYWSAEDEAFIAEVPELPGCMAAYRTARPMGKRLQTWSKSRWSDRNRPRIGQGNPCAKGQVGLRVEGWISSGGNYKCLADFFTSTVTNPVKLRIGIW